MSKTKKSENTVEVLYQKMGDRWYAFSVVDDEVFYGAVKSEDLPEVAEPEAAPQRGPSKDA